MVRIKEITTLLPIRIKCGLRDLHISITYGKKSHSDYENILLKEIIEKWNPAI
jgi:hypothetical protein